MVSSLWVWVCVVPGMRRRGERTRPADSCALRHRLVRLATLDVGVEVAGAARHAVDERADGLADVDAKRVLMRRSCVPVLGCGEYRVDPIHGFQDHSSVTHDPAAIGPDRVSPAARLTDLPGADHFLAILPHRSLPVGVVPLHASRKDRRNDDQHDAQHVIQRRVAVLPHFDVRPDCGKERETEQEHDELQHGVLPVGVGVGSVGRAGVEPAFAVRPVARQSGEPPKVPAAHRAVSWWVTWCPGLFGSRPRECPPALSLATRSPAVPAGFSGLQPMLGLASRAVSPGNRESNPSRRGRPSERLRGGPGGRGRARCGLASLSSPCSRGSDPRGSGSEPSRAVQPTLPDNLMAPPDSVKGRQCWRTCETGMCWCSLWLAGASRWCIRRMDDTDDRQGAWGPDPRRPRCPRCGARVSLVVAYRAPAARVEGGPVMLSAPCSYHVRGRGACRQPVVVVLEGTRVRYACPPSWEAMQGLGVEEILARWAPERVWAQEAGL